MVKGEAIMNVGHMKQWVMGVGMVCVLGGAVGAQAASLTGAIIFTADSAGNRGSGWANTDARNNSSFNVYVLPDLPSTSFGNGFLNSGNTFPGATSINIGLSVPGTYSFTMLGDTSAGSVGISNWGLNLFFNGDDLNSKISVFGLSNTTNQANIPAFSANSAASTATLEPFNLGNTPGAGTLTFIDGGNSITLTHYRLSHESIFAVDKVSGYGIGANGSLDGVVEFTLRVAPVNSTVPEPSTVLLLGSGLAGLAAWRRGRG
jgi:hypothetical protein